MADDSPKPLTPDSAIAAAGIARLDLVPERAAVVAPALDGMLAAFDLLDAVDIGETPPTNSFDPRWRDVK